jgi:oligoendopeptidase F
MPEAIRKRSEIETRYLWRLEDIFPSTEAWETSFAEIPGLSARLASFRGRLDDGAVLAECLDLETDLSCRMMELFTYARMRKDEDNAVSKNQALADRAMGEFYRISTETSFIVPEITALDETRLRGWMASVPGLSPYLHVLDDILRRRNHVLSEREERLLSMAGPMSEGISEAFTMMDNVDLKLGSITDENGETFELTHGRFGALRENRDARVRADAFERMHTAYAGFGNTISALYAASVKSDLFFAKARGHGTCLDAALFGDALPPDIHSSLVATVENHLPVLHRYLALRRKVMGLGRLRISDCYVPIVDTPDREFTFEQACGLVRKGLAPLGPAYLRDLETLLTDRWIDVYETEGKTNGAYAWGTYRSHPYMLLNYSGRVNDVFTLAHEAGHCLHTLYSNRRHYADAHYPTFLAEIASTVNENLLLRHLLAQCDVSTPEGRTEKAFLINHFLEEARGSVFRQTMFASFEQRVHEEAEKGAPLTAETLCGLYGELLSRYFGPDVDIDPFMKWEWARIPHFYSAFYVYKYATGFSAAAAISRAVLEQGAPVVERYLEFLGAGGSDYPAETLRRAGVDMATPAPVEAAMAEFSALVDELEVLLVG